MRARTLCVLVTAGLLTAGLTGVPAQAAARTATARTPAVAVTDQPPPQGLLAGPVPTRIHWTRWSRFVVYGGDTVLEGQVVTDDGALREAEVDLYARRTGARRWSRVGTAVASRRTAVFAFAGHRPRAGIDYRVVFDGDLVHARSEATRRVPVRRRVRDMMARVDAGRHALRGSVAPAYRRRAVLLQRRTCARCAWATVTRRRTTAASRWRFGLPPPPTRRTWYFRVVVPADASFARGYGDHVWWVRGG